MQGMMYAAPLLPHHVILSGGVYRIVANDTLYKTSCLHVIV